MYASTLQACAASYAWIGSAISTNLTLFYTDWNAQQGNTKVFDVNFETSRLWSKQVIAITECRPFHMYQMFFILRPMYHF